MLRSIIKISNGDQRVTVVHVVLSASTLLIREDVCEPVYHVLLNAVFRKNDQISPTSHTWSIAIMTIFDTHDELVQSLYDRFKASQAVITTLRKPYQLENPIDGFYNLFNSLNFDFDNIFSIQQSSQQQMLGYKSKEILGE